MRIALATTTALSGLVLALTLTGCSSSGGAAPGGAASSSSTDSLAASSPATSAPSTSLPPTSSTSSSAGAGGAGASSTGAGGGAAKTIAATGTLTDPVYDNTVQVLGAVRDFPLPASLADDSDEEIVLVHVKATAGNKYYVGLQLSALSIVTADGTKNPENTDPAIATAAAAAGYKELADDNIDTGTSATTWVAFLVQQKDSATLKLQMDRPAAHGSDGTNIAATSFDLPLVK